MVNDILELEDTIQNLIAEVEKKHNIVLTAISLFRPETEEAPVGQLDVKTQLFIATKLDR